MSDTLHRDYPKLGATTCPYNLYSSLREEGNSVGALPDVRLLSRHEDVQLALRHPEIFGSDEPPTPGDNADFGADDGVPLNNMLQRDPPLHTAQRRLVSKMFSPGRLRLHEPMIRGVVDDLLDGMVGRGRAEFVSEFATPLPVRVMCSMMGFPKEDYDWFVQWGRLEGRGVRFLDEAHRSEQAARAGRMGEYLAAAIRRRLVEPTDDILGEMVVLQRERDGETNLPYLVREAGLLLAGGVVTTAHMLSSALLLLLRRPDQLALVQAEPSRIPRLLEESLRLESPVQWLPRRCRVDTEIGGRVIPAGAQVILVLGSANRDERLFDVPDELDLERANVKSHVGFGHGVHFCLGAPLARLEGTIAFEEIFRRLPDLRLTPTAGEPKLMKSIMFRGIDELDISFGDPDGH
ncbi:cytochrome P450 [Pseudonocardia xishanensis]|uniref:Cytochrome P450 n=1 Tax=Pseudonocardia xishanensis TaxID=630995 RepID=A0ABP8RKA3_9PSEU